MDYADVIYLNLSFILDGRIGKVIEIIRADFKG